MLASKTLGSLELGGSRIFPRVARGPAVGNATRWLGGGGSTPVTLDRFASGFPPLSEATRPPRCTCKWGDTTFASSHPLAFLQPGLDA
ncbi:hypothetical protein LY76DRAFT_202346 [Colletotrichum caudatum]|nr:hypothetical protein LY76DRAFT_202346 [Colletotrichum caudatum]